MGKRDRFQFGYWSGNFLSTDWTPVNTRTAWSGVILYVVNHSNGCMENFDKARELAVLEPTRIELMAGILSEFLVVL